MTRTNKSFEPQHAGLPLLRAGKTIPPPLRRLIDERRRRQIAEFTEKVRIRQEAAKYSAILAAGPSPAEAKRAATGLRDISQRLAKRKVTASFAPKIPPYPVAGRQYVFKIPPPYDTAKKDRQALQGNPSMQASADATTGQMSASVITNYNSPSFGYVMIELGLCFSPPVGPSVLTGWVTPAINFSAWVNSEWAPVMASGGLTFGIDSVAPDGSRNDLNGVIYGLFSANPQTGLDFDFGSVTPTLSTQITLNTNDLCYAYVNYAAVAFAQGWPSPPVNPRNPGSLAGMTAAFTLPFFGLDFDVIPDLRP